MGMTKVEAEKRFKVEFADLLEGTDKPAIRMAWNVYTDTLCKEGSITEKQYNQWNYPNFIK